MEEEDQAAELFDGLFECFLPFLRGSELGFAAHAALRVGAGPGGDGRDTGSKQVYPVEFTFKVVRSNFAFVQVPAYMVTIEIKIHSRFKFTGMGTTTRRLALPPAGKERLVHGEQHPPGQSYAFRGGLQIGAAGDQIQIGHIRTVAVQQNDFLNCKF